MPHPLGLLLFSLIIFYSLRVPANTLLPLRILYFPANTLLRGDANQRLSNAGAHSLVQCTRRRNVRDGMPPGGG